MMKIPVLFIIFNRPEITNISFKEIRNYKPTKLYIAGDGPRQKNKKDEYLVKKTRKILEKIDWKCEKKIMFNEKNLGCKVAVVKAIDWFFEKEEKAIILEDDCVPSKDFFKFCQILLERYKNDNKIISITGSNFVDSNNDEESYYFSKYFNPWGWATWREKWKLYDLQLSFWPEYKQTKKWKDNLPNFTERLFWYKKINDTYLNKIDTWDYQMIALAFYKNLLTIAPKKNLIKNIGFGNDATHTVISNKFLEDLSIENLDNIKHPKNIIQNLKADRSIFKYRFGGNNYRFPKIFFYIFLKLLKKIKKLFN